MVLLANKYDLSDQFEFTETEVKAIASEQNLPFFIASAKNGDNVIKAFFKLGDLIIDNVFNINTNAKDQNKLIVKPAA